MTYHMMTRNFDSVSRSDYFSTESNFHFTKDSFTKTITNRYTAIVSTNTCNTVQYDIEHVKRVTDSANISNLLIFLIISARF
ncbi:hypothetical protein ARALYDRAFT_920407 [Arabidopsis lyrata subsp. lyrata]|uniref:Uncharacterized protein n=1 Tax=Arabidopsis lyrata subsp. lyrata TaxID=81972 RepID=D7MX08_ARALL|nr:hypothetical protein ARALYDRAFT_920407 [Arabidopsis lyrata subsp. lyrata]